MADPWKRASDFIESVSGGDEMSEVPWRADVMERLAEGDVEGMKEAASPSAEFELIKMAHEGESEQLRLQAIQYVLGQAGHGVINKVDKRVSYDSLPTDQLVAMLRSKLGKLQELVPGFSLDGLLEGIKAPEAVEAEVISITTEATDGE